MTSVLVDAVGEVVCQVDCCTLTHSGSSLYSAPDFSGQYSSQRPGVQGRGGTECLGGRKSRTLRAASEGRKVYRSGGARSEGRGGVTAVARGGHRRGEPGGSGGAAGAGAVAARVPGRGPAGAEGEEPGGRGTDANPGEAGGDDHAGRAAGGTPRTKEGTGTSFGSS